jgi:glycerol-3-phosphate acyltransferase PlsY
MMIYVLTGIVAYLLGSVPTAVWVGKAWYNIDVREQGSKNAGATNTFRVLGKKPGIIVLLVDVLKGALAVSFPIILKSIELFSGEVNPDTLQIIAAVLAVVGHIFPVFAGFRGGKGVATSLGIVIGLQPLAAAVCLTVFMIVFIVSNYISLGSIIASICFPFVVWYFRPDSMQMQIFSIVLGAAVILAHKKNIGRLMKGEENKMNLFKK